MRQLAFVNLLKSLARAAFAMYVAANAKNQHLNTGEGGLHQGIKLQQMSNKYNCLFSLPLELSQ